MKMTVPKHFRCWILLGLVLGGQHLFAQMLSDSTTGFPPLDQWRSAIVGGDPAALKALYSSDPPAQVQANGATAGADADVDFWLALKARSMELEIVRLKEKPGAESVIFKAEVKRQGCRMARP